MPLNGSFAKSKSVRLLLLLVFAGSLCMVGLVIAYGRMTTRQTDVSETIAVLDGQSKTVGGRMLHEISWVMAENRQLRAEHEMLLLQIAQLGHANTVMNAYIANANQQNALRGAYSYTSLYDLMRSFFGYESPLVPASIPARAAEKFRRTAPGLINFRVEQQQKLWASFGTACDFGAEPEELLRTGDMFPNVDRIVLFCLLQRLRPGRMLEIGSGESTEVARQALMLVEHSGGPRCEHTAIEPYRSSAVPAGVHVIAREMQDLGFDLFDGLEEGDVLFMDSSHVIMPYGDTLTELVTVLPRLSTGVYIHIHDIFLPYDYPPEWKGGRAPDGQWWMKRNIYTEQWAVALMLAGAESEWEVVWSSHLMVEEHASVLRSLRPLQHILQPTLSSGAESVSHEHLEAVDQELVGGSLWLRKIGSPKR